MVEYKSVFYVITNIIIKHFVRHQKGLLKYRIGKIIFSKICSVCYKN